MVQAEASGKTCFDIGEAQPIDAERAVVQAEASGKTCFDIGEAQPIDAERAGWGEYDSLKNRKKGTAPFFRKRK